MKKILKIIVGIILLGLVINQPVYANEEVELSDEIIEYCEYFGSMYGISPELLESIVWNESRGDTTAQNGTCAGICQINTASHKDRIKRITSINGIDSDNIYDTKLQIHLCADYIYELAYEGYAEEQNDIALVLAWYHGEKKLKRNMNRVIFHLMLKACLLYPVSLKRNTENMELYKHQQKALEMTKDHNSCAYYLDMGLGKTYVGSRKMMELDKRVNLLICQKSKVNDWIDHFTEYDSTYWNNNLIYDLTNKNGLKAFFDVIADNSYTQRIIGVINYDLVWRRPILKKIDIGTLMLDESQNIQNRQNKRSKFIMKIDADNVILLSGTPTNGKYENLWSQLHMIGWNITEDVYLNTYVDYEWLQNEGGFWFRKIHGYKNVDRLKRKMADHGVVFMKTDECFELPEQRDVIIKVDSSDDYKFFMKNDIVTLEDDTELVGDTVLTKFLKARQLCGQYSKNKLNAFEELISSTDEKLIVFYNFTAELDHMIPIAALQNKPISFVNGQHKELNNYENEENSITFIQFQAGATGLNLQKAHIVIYFSLPFGKGSCAMWEQSKKRIHRIGQKNNCIYYYLLCKDSIEPLNLTQLQIGKEYNDELFKKEVSKCQQAYK